MKLQYSTCTI